MFLSRLSEADEHGYQGVYLTSQPLRSLASLSESSLTASPPVERRKRPPEVSLMSSPDIPYATPPDNRMIGSKTECDHTPFEHTPDNTAPPVDDIAEAVFFAYGVVVFFGLDERQEKNILEDIEKAGTLNRTIEEEDWEVEEFHFAVRFRNLLSTSSKHVDISKQQDPDIAYPRIYNDFFSETLPRETFLILIDSCHLLTSTQIRFKFAQTINCACPCTVYAPCSL